jgi:hypothetical protein
VSSSDDDLTGDDSETGDDDLEDSEEVSSIEDSLEDAIQEDGEEDDGSPREREPCVDQNDAADPFEIELSHQNVGLDVESEADYQDSKQHMLSLMGYSGNDFEDPSDLNSSDLGSPFYDSISSSQYLNSPLSPGYDGISDLGPAPSQSPRYTKPVASTILRNGLRIESSPSANQRETNGDDHNLLKMKSQLQVLRSDYQTEEPMEEVDSTDTPTEITAIQLASDPQMLVTFAQIVGHEINDNGKKKYVEYQIQVQHRDHHHLISKRYSELFGLDHKLHKWFPEIKFPTFPSKRLFGSSIDDSLISYRTTKINKYLDFVFQQPEVVKYPMVEEFFEIIHYESELMEPETPVGPCYDDPLDAPQLSSAPTSPVSQPDRAAHEDDVPRLRSSSFGEVGKQSKSKKNDSTFSQVRHQTSKIIRKVGRAYSAVEFNPETGGGSRRGSKLVSAIERSIQFLPARLGQGEDDELQQSLAAEKKARRKAKKARKKAEKIAEKQAKKDQKLKDKEDRRRAKLLETQDGEDGDQRSMVSNRSQSKKKKKKRADTGGKLNPARSIELSDVALALAPIVRKRRRNFNLPLLKLRDLASGVSLPSFPSADGDDDNATPTIVSSSTSPGSAFKRSLAGLIGRPLILRSDRSLDSPSTPLDPVQLPGPPDHSEETPVELEEPTPDDDEGIQVPGVQHVSMARAKVCLEDFQLIRLIGKGTFGKVSEHFFDSVG